MYGWRRLKVRFVNCCGIGRYARSWVRPRASGWRPTIRKRRWLSIIDARILIFLRHRLDSMFDASSGIASPGLLWHYQITGGLRASEPTAHGEHSLRRYADAEAMSLVRDNWEVRFCDNYDGRW